MNELKFTVDSVEPLLFFGANNELFELIRKQFPKLKIIARGNEIRAMGEESSLQIFAQKYDEIIRHIEHYQSLTENDLETIIGNAIKDYSQQQEDKTIPHDVIVYGHNGLVVKARTQNQQKMVDSAQKNDIIFSIGPAGTGKTYTAVALAVRALKNKEVKRIILTRPAVEAGESLGFLPGDLKEKIDPYLRPLYDALDDMIPPEKLKFYLENRTIEIAPLAFMRGRTLDNCFVILDEAQNTTSLQLKMFLTRMGPSAKFIVTGDMTQVDLPQKQQSSLPNALKLLENIKGIDIIYLSGQDVVRHKLVKKILEAYGDI